MNESDTPGTPTNPTNPSTPGTTAHPGSSVPFGSQAYPYDGPYAVLRARTQSVRL